jgi:hypothetical protein
MPQLGEPFDWGTPWDGTEFESIIEKTDGHGEELSILQEKLHGLKYDFETFKNETIKMITNIYKKLHED